MNYEEFRHQLGKAGLTNKAFAELLDLNPNSITNFKAKGNIPSHLAVIVVFMAEFRDRGIDFKIMIEKLELKKQSLTRDLFDL
jgi:hypothetical protein